MPPTPSDARCSPAATPELLRQAPLIRSLSEEQRVSLASQSSVVAWTPGSILIAEGAIGDLCGVVLSGEAMLTTLSAKEEVIVDHFRRGDLFGEGALLDTAEIATVRAGEALTVLTLPLDVVRAIVRGYPLARKELEQLARDRNEARFLRLATPFRTLATHHLRALAMRIEAIHHRKGDAIVAEGESGDRAFLLMDGTAEVILGAGTAAERRIASLGRGAMVGEASLLTGDRRNASVRATSDVTLLQLTRDDFLSVVERDRRVARSVVEFFSLRKRPKRLDDVDVVPFIGEDGTELRLIRNRATGASYKISPQAWFLWERLDGRHTLRDLALDYFGEYKAFAPEAIAAHMVGLAAAGFIDIGKMPDLSLVLSPTQRLLLGVRSVLTFQKSWGNADRFFSAIYKPFKLLFTPLGQILCAAAATSGICLLVANASSFLRTIADAGFPRAFLAFLAAYLVSTVVHESAHGLTAKFYDRRVPRFGFGWNWFVPIAFVDTSEMWLSPWKARVLTTLSGPYANAVLGGIAAIGAHFATQEVLRLPLSALALFSFVMCAFNLLPFLQFDGDRALRDFREARKPS